MPGTHGHLFLSLFSGHFFFPSFLKCARYTPSFFPSLFLASKRPLFNFPPFPEEESLVSTGPISEIGQPILGIMTSNASHDAQSGCPKWFGQELEKSQLWLPKSCPKVDRGRNNNGGWPSVFLW